MTNAQISAEADQFTADQLRGFLRGRPRCENVDSITDAAVRTVWLLAGRPTV
jgi:hypothetical protein